MQEQSWSLTAPLAIVLRHSPPAGWRHRAALTLTAFFVVSACSSTTQRLDQVKKRERTEELAGTGELQESSPVTGAPGSARKRTRTGTVGAQAGSGSTGSTNTSAEGASGTNRPVEIGVLGYKNVGAFAAAVGTPLDIGDNKGQIKAVVDYVNAHGGLLGRKIVPIIYEYDSTTTEQYGAVDQEICAHWTEDHHVFAAVVPSTDATHILPACLNKRGVPMMNISAGNYALKEHFERWPLMVEPTYLSIDRAYRLLIRRLHARNYFGRGAKVGLVRFDGPHFKRVSDTIVKSELARVGIKLTDEYPIAVPQSTAEFADVGTEAQNAQLRFRSKGIDHVIIMDITGLITGQFMVSAESSGYRPRYGLTSDASPAAVADDAPAQLHGALGVSWRIVDDAEYLRAPEKNGLAAKRCKDILRKAGQEPGDRLFAFHYCDMFFSLQASVAKGGALSAAAFLSGFNRLGANYAPATTFGTRFGPTKHDGPAFVRDIGYVDGCSCFRFQSGNLPVE